MRIGDLRHRVTLQSATLAPDGMGGNTATWAHVADVYAAIWPTSAKEQVAGGQTSLEVIHRVRIRYRLNLKASWRLKYGDRYFAIVSVINPNEAGKMLDMLVKEAAS
jgi:SPP1 family predicted phage head-tail adaptor